MLQLGEFSLAQQGSREGAPAVSGARHQHRGEYLERQLLPKNSWKSFQEQSWNSPSAQSSSQTQGTEMGVRRDRCLSMNYPSCGSGGRRGGSVGLLLETSHPMDLEAE